MSRGPDLSHGSLHVRCWYGFSIMQHVLHNQFCCTPHMMTQWLVCTSRQLAKGEFTVFLQRYCLLSDNKLSDIADDMIRRLSEPDQEGPPSEDVMLEQLHALSAQQA